MEYEIVALPRETWRDHIVPIGYRTEEYYDVRAESRENGFAFLLEKKRLDVPAIHMPEEYDYPDRLYAEWYPEAQAFGVLDGERLVAVIEMCPETWSNRLRITELWVDASLRGHGVGHALMEMAKAHAVSAGHRAVILETQSCNVNAIGFYLHEGFMLVGLDTCCYGNHDMERGEVRIEMGWLLPADAGDKAERR